MKKRRSQRKSQFERDMAEELRFHLEHQVAANISAGMHPDEARRNAKAQLGAVEGVKENCREQRRGFWLESICADIRYALRVLRKSPAFTAVAVLTLALGIGANTAIFSILESQLWRALPFDHAERLMDAHVVLRKKPRQWDVLSTAEFRAWRDQSQSFSSIAAYLYPADRNLTANGVSERVVVMSATSNLFATLGIPLARGRTFLPGEDAQGRDHVAILSKTLWNDRFGSDPGVLGRSVEIDGQAYTVVGIAPATLRFEYIDEPAIFVPLNLQQAPVALRNLYVVARLAPHVTPQQASEELTVILRRADQTHGIPLDDIAVVGNLRETWTGFAARPLYFFAGAVALVLFLACVNVAGLLLARGLARQREFALRAALGASAHRIVRQLLVESVMLAIVGGATGALAGVWLAQWFVVFLPEDALPRHAAVSFDPRVFAFAVLVSLIAALLAGIGPTVVATRGDLNSAFAQNSPGRSANRGQMRARTALVAIEIALAVVLLFGSGLFVSTFFHLQQAPRGFDAPGALTFRVSLRGNNYKNPDQVKHYFDLLSGNLDSLPGVRQVTIGSDLPLTGVDNLGCVNIAGRPPLRPDGICMDLYSVGADYFRALHMHLLAGRAFKSNDVDGSVRVAIINRNASQRLFGSSNPIGKVLDFVKDQRRGVPQASPVQIVGLVDNAQEFGADEMPFEGIYLPFEQYPVASEYVLVDSAVPRGALAGAVRSAAFKLDKDQPVFDMKTMDDRIADSLEGARFNLFLTGALATLAILLVCIGAFGTVAYLAQQRTQEFGIRLALGASKWNIFGLAIANSSRVAIAGISMGIALSLVLGRMLRYALYLAPHEHSGMLYGVSIDDPYLLGAASVLLLAVVLVASYIPARRAMRVDPIVALRHE